MIEHGVFFKLIHVGLEQGMLDNVGESYSFFAINYKYFFEEILDVFIGFFEFFLLGDHSCEVEVGIAFSMDVGLHVVSLIRKGVPLKGY